MVSKAGECYIIDFAVNNIYPRIVELAVPLCNLFRNLSYEFVVDEYQAHNKLTPEELHALPLFVKAAYAMHVIGAVRERDIYGNHTAENEYWLAQGRKGLGIRV